MVAGCKKQIPETLGREAGAIRFDRSVDRPPILTRSSGDPNEKRSTAETFHHVGLPQIFGLPGTGPNNDRDRAQACNLVNGRELSEIDSAKIQREQPSLDRFVAKFAHPVSRRLSYYFFLDLARFFFAISSAFVGSVEATDLYFRDIRSKSESYARMQLSRVYTR